MASPTLPSSSHSIGDTGHTTDHDTLVTAFSSMALLVENVNSQSSVSSTYTIPDPTTTWTTVHKLTLTGNVTITLPSVAAGKSCTILTIQDGTGGRTITWATPSGAIKWPGGAAPTYTSTASAQDLTTFVCVDGTNWLGLPAGYAFA